MSRRTVLVIEHDSLSMRICHECLEKSGATILSARDLASGESILAAKGLRIREVYIGGLKVDRLATLLGFIRWATQSKHKKVYNIGPALRSDEARRIGFSGSRSFQDLAVSA